MAPSHRCRRKRPSFSEDDEDRDGAAGGEPERIGVPRRPEQSRARRLGSAPEGPRRPRASEGAETGWPPTSPAIDPLRPERESPGDRAAVQTAPAARRGCTSIEGTEEALWEHALSTVTSATCLSVRRQSSSRPSTKSVEAAICQADPTTCSRSLLFGTMLHLVLKLLNFFPRPPSPYFWL